MRALIVGLLLALAASAHAQAPALTSPYAPELRAHYYQQLAKNPWRALGWELFFPGAGSLQTGLYAPAIATLALSVTGASLWLTGALREHAVLEGVGMGTFALARGYGLVSAPVGAVLLNAAFRRQLGVRLQVTRR